MRRTLVAFSLAAFTLSLAAQAPPVIASRSKVVAKDSMPSTTAASTATANSAAIKDLPVRKVVLYKNGVGYLSTPAR
jgi:hypothetical protein